MRPGWGDDLVKEQRSILETIQKQDPNDEPSEESSDESDEPPEPLLAFFHAVSSQYLMASVRSNEPDTCASVPAALSVLFFSEQMMDLMCMPIQQRTEK